MAILKTLVKIKMTTVTLTDQMERGMNVCIMTVNEATMKKKFQSKCTTFLFA